MVSDPESKVSVVGCMENGAKDISIVSEKVSIKICAKLILKLFLLDKPDTQHL